MAFKQKVYANQEMHEKFMKIVREELTDVHFIFELNDDNCSNNGDAVTEPPAPKIVRYSVDGKTSDGGEGDIIKISAHKKVLVASSPVFNAMFNGGLKETGDVKIVDVSPDAFREFLQIFYDSDVKLTMGNLGEVMKLTDKYDVEAGWPIIDTFAKVNIAVDDVLWCLHLATKFRRDDLITHCTDMIEQNSAKVCDMVELDDNGKPKLCSNPNNRPITDADLANIFPRIFTMIKKYVSESVKLAGVVTLRLLSSGPLCSIAHIQDISFSSNRPLLLTHIIYTKICTKSYRYIKEYDIKVCIAGMESTYSYIQDNGGIIKCKNPILIETNRTYTIQTEIVTSLKASSLMFARETLSEPVRVAPDIEITFDKVHSNSIVAGMKFLRYDH